MIVLLGNFAKRIPRSDSVATDQRRYVGGPEGLEGRSRGQILYGQAKQIWNSSGAHWRKRRRSAKRSPLNYLLCVLSATFLFLPETVLATRIPGLGDIPNGYFFTTETDLVKVVLKVNINRQNASEPLANFQIPRAYIYLTSHHSEKGFERLPSEIEAKDIYVVLTYPDGVPYSIALARLREEISLARRQGDLGGESAVQQLRPLLITAEISGSLPNAYRSATFSPRDYEAYLGNYETLRRHSTIGVSEVYFGQPNDLIRKVWCPRSLENVNPNHLCKYFTVLSPHVIAKVSFVDFRAHGGIAFAEERIRAFKKTICQYLECD